MLAGIAGRRSWAAFGAAYVAASRTPALHRARSPTTRAFVLEKASEGRDNNEAIVTARSETCSGAAGWKVDSRVC